MHFSRQSTFLTYAIIPRSLGGEHRDLARLKRKLKQLNLADGFYDVATPEVYLVWVHVFLTKGVVRSESVKGKFRSGDSVTRARSHFFFQAVEQ